MDKVTEMLYYFGLKGFSDEWVTTVGISAKSSLSGGLFLVMPSVMGLAVYSPLLDARGNSMRAVKFCSKLIDKYPAFVS